MDRACSFKGGAVAVGSSLSSYLPSRRICATSSILSSSSCPVERRRI